MKKHDTYDGRPTPSVERRNYTTKSWAEAERFLSDLRGRLADGITRASNLEVEVRQAKDALVHAQNARTAEIGDQAKMIAAIHDDYANRMNAERKSVAETLRIQAQRGLADQNRIELLEHLLLLKLQEQYEPE